MDSFLHRMEKDVLETVLLVAAVVCFIAAALGFSPRGINLGWLGLALWLVTALI